MIGEKIHSYHINAHLGQGGMGNVYRATDTMLGREVALKMLHPQLTMQTQFLERFKKEARVLAQLLHPNIAVIYNFIEQQGNHFMVMEYVEGASLDELLKKYGTLPPEFVVPVFIQALEGLQHAHRKHIFHRDIKPSNIMLTPDGTVKLMDFGIAKVAGEQKMTQVNKIVGTVEFMAPELIQGKDASALSDIYAMGVTLYELISGKLPFESDTDFNLMQAILKKKPSPPDKLNASVPRPLADIVMKALDKNPDHRFTDARAFQQALANAFPSFREINLAALKPVIAGSVLAQTAGAITQPNKDLMTAVAMETRVETWANQNSFLEKTKQHILRNRKWYLIAAALLFFLLITVGIVNRNKDTELAQGDTLKTGSENTASANTPTKTDLEQPQVVNVPPPPERDDQKKIPDIKSETAKPKENKVERKQPEQKTEDESVKAKESLVETPAEKPVEKKDVYVTTKVEVELFLRDDLGDSPERKDIPVTFSVRYRVMYSGVTIVQQGAIATGTIKLGKVQTDVSINSVTAANGQQIQIKALKGHGKRNTITSDRSYTAIIPPGTRINF
jgi:serine/threonine-protein kinase